MRSPTLPTSTPVAAVAAALPSTRYWVVTLIRFILTAVRYLWASPCSLIGLVGAGFILLLGGDVRSHGGVLLASLPEPQRARSHRYDAITLGHVVLSRGARQLARLLDHELVHVRQFERWGPLLFVAYPISSFVQLLRGRDAYRDNYFEVQARLANEKNRKST